MERFALLSEFLYFIRYRKAWQNHRLRKSEANLRMLGKMQAAPHSELGHLRQALPYE